MNRPDARARLPRALPLLEDIEQLGGAATGTLLFRDERESLGVVFVQLGRVCWATSKDMRGRLTDLLLAQSQDSLDRGGSKRCTRDAERAGLHWERR